MKRSSLFAIAGICLISFSACQKDSATPASDIPELVGGNNKSTVPFKGSFNTLATILQPPPMLRQEIRGTGNATHLGKATFVAISNINMTTAPPFSISGTTEFTGANGDKIYSTFTGTATPSQGRLIVNIYGNITGGTGRFADATGYINGYTIGTPGHLEGFIVNEGEISY